MGNGDLLLTRRQSMQTTQDDDVDVTVNYTVQPAITGRRHHTATGNDIDFITLSSPGVASAALIVRK